MANPDQVEKIFVGKGADVGDQFLALALANRHALIAGTTTRKTASPQVSAASFSRTGVPMLAADGERDLFGIAEPGDAKPKFIKRAKDLGFGHALEKLPDLFCDLFGEQATRFVRRSSKRARALAGQAVLRYRHRQSQATSFLKSRRAQARLAVSREGEPNGRI